jgi:thioesterase domain-containing protein
MIVIGNVRKDERRPEWQKYVAGMVHVHHVEGDHRSYLKEKLVDTAKTIGRILAGTG